MRAIKRKIVKLQRDGMWHLITLSCGHNYTGMGGDLRVGAVRNCFECS